MTRVHVLSARALTAGRAAAGLASGGPRSVRTGVRRVRSKATIAIALLRTRL